MSFLNTNRGDSQEEYSHAPDGDKIFLNGDLECYVSGDKNSKAAIVYIYDIFGNHSNAYEGADIFARHGYRVIMPDFLRNNPVRVEMLGDWQRIKSRFETKESYEMLESDFKAVKDYLVNVEGFDKVLLVGFCWGAKKAMELSEHDDFYLGGALFHPSFLTLEDFKGVQAPMIIQPSMHDPDFTEGFEIISQKSFGDLCYIQVYDDMIHGFASGRGDWSDSHVRVRTNEAFSNALRGFGRILAEKS
ncbi:putative AIM2 family protein [Smittium mucronatum]|uniref:Putative AIM2 family protein n=1 Tax=Smittium mucronatum TaxID=133383 RepID=A0A1R0H563_9FUNG|nr:putative AIM2 family protein [Smittium mucronatum]